MTIKYYPNTLEGACQAQLDMKKAFQIVGRNKNLTNTMKFVTPEGYNYLRQEIAQAVVDPNDDYSKKCMNF